MIRPVRAAGCDCDTIATPSALLAGSFNREVTIARTLSACNEGTPAIYSASLTPDIDHSVIDIGFHYQRACDVDRPGARPADQFHVVDRRSRTPGWSDAITAAAAAQGRNDRAAISAIATPCCSTTSGTPCTRRNTPRVISPPGGSTCTPGRRARPPTCPSRRMAAAARSRTRASPLITSPCGQTGGRRVGVRPVGGAAPGEAGTAGVLPRVRHRLADPATGLSGTYFDNRDFTGSTLVRDRPAHRFRLRHGAAVAEPRCGPVRRALVRPGAGGSVREPTPSTPRPTTAPGSGSTASTGERLDRSRRRREPRHHRA